MKPVRKHVKDYEMYFQHRFGKRYNLQLDAAASCIDFRAADWRELELADALRDILGKVRT